MTDRVVDTNVPIAANGRATHANDSCQSACVNVLTSLQKREVVAIDDRGDILAEYARRLSLRGELGPGDEFLMYVFNKQYDPARVRRVSISPNNDEGRGFDELPSNSFDASDRKFLAVAVAASAVVLNATDSDWDEHAELMQKLGVEVCQLCPQHATRQTARKRRRQRG